MGKEIYLSWEEVLGRLSHIDKKENVIYGIPKGGMILCAFLKNASVTPDPSYANLILDDIWDSGATMEKYMSKYPGSQFYVLVDKRIEFKEDWVVFPWERDHPAGKDTIQSNIRRLLQYIGEDVEREGLQGTPDRVARMYDEIFRGYDENQRPRIATFTNGADGLTYDQMIVDEGTFYSHCEHHMVPFFGDYRFAYIPAPEGRIVGLSKVARLVDYYAAKLQIQERLVNDIVEDLWNELSAGGVPPLGMALMMKGEHLCKTMRGAKKKGSMTTIKLKGVFLEKPSVKEEFLKI